MSREDKKQKFIETFDTLEVPVQHALAYDMLLEKALWIKAENGGKSLTEDEIKDLVTKAETGKGTYWEPEDMGSMLFSTNILEKNGFERKEFQAAKESPESASEKSVKAIEIKVKAIESNFYNPEAKDLKEDRQR